MCERHSFVIDKEGKVYNGGGFEESHTVICLINGIKQDDVNAYEWQPPKGWPDANAFEGIKKDQINFDEKSSHIKAIEQYLLGLFPTQASFETYFLDEAWHGKEIESPSGKYIIAIKKEPLVVGISATVKAYNNSTVKAWDNSTVEAYNNSTVEARGNSTVKATGNSTIEATDNAVVEAYGNSTVIKRVHYGNKAEVKKLEGLAVLIDRSVEGKVTVTKAGD